MSIWKEEKIERVVKEMEKIAKSERFLEIPLDVIEEAGKLFKSLKEEKFISGYPGIIIALACFYYVIRIDPSCPAISFKQFKEAIPIVEDGIAPCYDPKNILRVYQKIIEKYGITPQTCTVRPTIFVKKFGSMMGFDS